MKKILLTILSIMFVFVLGGCTKSESTTASSSAQSSASQSQSQTEKHTLNVVLKAEQKASFDFFWDEAVSDESSLGLGLIPDRYPSVDLCSIASVGFGLAAIPIGVENGYITRKDGEARAISILKGMKKLKTVEGFYFHFYNKYTGQVSSGSEVSNIDTSIMLAGGLVCASYFDGEVETLFNSIYDAVNWPWFINKTTNNFYMSYNDTTKSFAGQWDFYAEQLMMYFLAAGSNTHPIDSTPYYSFKRVYGSYGEDRFVHSWFGSLFTYQFSHVFIDFRNIRDKLGMDWYENSVKASRANYNYCVDNPDGFVGFGQNGWGLTACDSPSGYSGYFGAVPNGYDNKQIKNDGTIPPCGALGSLVFVPDLVIPTMNYYSKIPNLIGDYGFKDAFNLEGDNIWIDSSVIGIDKGIGLLMIENYRSDLIWNLFMENQITKKALNVLEFSQV